jgi:hypothetical protein
LPPKKASWSCPLIPLKFELQLLFSAFNVFLVLYIGFPEKVVDPAKFGA